MPKVRIELTMNVLVHSINTDNNTARSSTDNSDFASNALATFTRSIRAITSVPPQPTPESFSSLYSLCEGCVPVATSSTNAGSGNLAQTLYDRIRIELERKVGEVKRALVKNLPPWSEQDGPTDDAAEVWLQQLNEEWNAFSQQLSLIRAIFTHLDRTFVLQRKSLLSIWSVLHISVSNRSHICSQLPLN